MERGANLDAQPTTQDVQLANGQPLVRHEVAQHQSLRERRDELDALHRVAEVAKEPYLIDPALVGREGDGALQQRRHLG